MDDSLISTAPRRLTSTPERVSLARSVPARRRRDGGVLAREDQEIYKVVASAEGTVEVVGKRAGWREEWVVRFKGRGECGVRVRRGREGKGAGAGGGAAEGE
ncbi:hypothetical protein MMC30_006304 [Trapelia coarctata]|nr:hypothetical protein [Trapelia coarctata]